MKIGKAISFIFDDPNWWKKLFIGTLILLIPIIGWLVVNGWRLEIIKRVAKDHPEPLPSFNEFGSYLSLGVKSFLVYIVYKSPLILFFMIIISLFLVPFWPNGNVSDIELVFLFFFIIGGLIIAFPIDLILTFFERPAQMELAVKGELSSAFNLSAVGDLLKITWGQILLALLVVFLAAVIIHPIGTILIFIGTLVSHVLLSAFSGHLYGQIYDKAKPITQIDEGVDPTVITM